MKYGAHRCPYNLRIEYIDRRRDNGDIVDVKSDRSPYNRADVSCIRRIHQDNVIPLGYVMLELSENTYDKAVSFGRKYVERLVAHRHLYVELLAESVQSVVVFGFAVYENLFDRLGNAFQKLDCKRGSKRIRIIAVVSVF